MNWLDDIKWNAEGLVPAIAQERSSGKILMMAWMNRMALEQTALNGKAIYWSRSRHRLWRKGEESGHEQQVHDIRLDCDGDAVLLVVTQSGGMACHTGRHSCFFRRWEDGRWVTVEEVLQDPAMNYGERGGMSEVLERLAKVLEARKQADPKSSYVAGLYARGLHAILKKIGEEATETIIAAKEGRADHLIYEVADLWFHTLVLLAQQGLHPDQVLAELERRYGQSGIQERAARLDRDR